jgi:exodeoxyribonuclease V alpha subunit
MIDWPSLENLNLSPHQKLVGTQALNPASNIAILGGSPGTGKTWLVSELVIAFEQLIGLDNVLVGAPTGKASVRVTENLQAKQIALRARTWHSLLMQLEMQKEEFFHQKVLISDESSMLDTDLFANIMRHIPRGSLFLIVGDCNQLPPVGHGAPMRDLIAAGVPYGELTEIIRNSGGIVETCAAIRDQKPWHSGDNLLLVETEQPANQLTEIENILKEAKASGLDPVWDCQVVVAVNEKSPLSRGVVNLHLQSILNRQPGEEVKGRVGFRVGDKVVNTKNGFFNSLIAQEFGGAEDVEANDKEEVFIANGELAKVESVDAGSMVCTLDSPSRRVQIFFGAEGGCTFELGYALSVHKSQGSDWPWVIVVLDDYPGAKMVCDRSWLYTAISRAKQKCWLVGKKQTAVRMCKVSKIWHRKTFLRERILSARSRGILANV